MSYLLFPFHWPLFRLSLPVLVALLSMMTVENDDVDDDGDEE